MFPLPPFYYFEIGALLISLAFLYRFDTHPLRWFIPYLTLMVCIEFTARYYRKVLHEPNTWLYNISIPVEYLFYGFMIGSLCLTRSFRKTILYASFIFAVFTIINLLFIQGFTDLNTNTLKAGSSLMIIFSAIGLIDLFTNDNHSSLIKNPLFWICTGVLFFNTGEFLYLFFFDIFLKNKWDETAKLFASINNKLIYILYTCISIAIICSKRSGKKV
ncbi:MAG TPA: hypothetical protein VHL77_07190 [Ferruginibacter sp.]|nr:hypothetical protein [Ferruginibacter sp.]